MYILKLDREIDNAFWLILPFDEKCVVDLKAELPLHARRWDGEREAWWIHGDYLCQAERIAQRYFQPEVPLDIFRMDPYELLRLPPGAHWQEAHSAYMGLARECLDDVQRLRELELAFQAILDGYQGESKVVSMEHEHIGRECL